MKLWQVGPKVKRNDIVKILVAKRGLDLDPVRPEKLTLKSVGIKTVAVKKAVTRINRAITNQETVVVYGDYDADGIGATAIMWEALHSLGVSVWPFIPHREEHGYGLSIRGIEAMIAQRRPGLVVTVDNGIVAHQAAKKLAQEKIDLIITDHHQVGKKLPEAAAIIHTTSLCGAGIAWMVAKELNPQAAKASLDLAALGTVADMMELKAANRSLVKYGLESLRQTDRVGLVELYREAGVDSATIDTSEINFMIAPRLNATGRVGHGLDSLRLVCTHDRQRAKELAQTLGQANKDRQLRLQEQLEQAKTSLGTMVAEEKILVVADAAYHQGVIGLIAGKLTEEFYRPSVVLSIKGGQAKASARSIPGFNIIEAIREAEDLILEAGGHPMAAGFSVETDKIAAVTEKLRQVAKKQLDEAKLQPVVKIDCEVEAKDISLQLWQELEQLAPFGVGNPRPTLALMNVSVAEARLVGGEGKHLKLRLKELPQTETIGFNLGHLSPQLTLGRQVDVAFQLARNVWSGQEKLELRIKDVR
jgi:single-stranded-DNA-specific exonuclease